MTATITSDEIGDILLFKIEGEFDVDCADELKPQLVRFFEGNKKYLMIDISKIDYVDSSGLGLLVGAVRTCNQGQRIFILGPSTRVSRALEITGLDRIFNIYPNMQDALESI